MFHLHLISQHARQIMLCILLCMCDFIIYICSHYYLNFCTTLAIIYLIKRLCEPVFIFCYALISAQFFQGCTWTFFLLVHSLSELMFAFILLSFNILLSTHAKSVTQLHWSRQNTRFATVLSRECLDALAELVHCTAVCSKDSLCVCRKVSTSI